VTADEFDIQEPFRSYVFLYLLFDCRRCKKTFSGDPPYPANPDWQWFHDTAEQARKAGWSASFEKGCLCPDCAKSLKAHVCSLSS
jgi:hypothetical protein